MDRVKYIARFILDAKTPLFVGSGEKSLMKDALVSTDFNGLPYIPGSSLAGVLRHSLCDGNEEATKKWNTFFGHESDNNNEGKGSQISISNAVMLMDDSIYSECTNNNLDEVTMAHFEYLPKRQHVRLTDRGAAADKGLFDNEVVYKGLQFIFEVALDGTSEDENDWHLILTELKKPGFRLGQGTRNGYGSLEVKSILMRKYNFQSEEDKKGYLDYDASFNAEFKGSEPFGLSSDFNDLIHYQLKLQPDGMFFIFSEGHGDEEVDNKPIEEDVAKYIEGKLTFEKETLIPASSIKGALAHRTAFHYNKNRRVFIDELFHLGDKIVRELYTGSNNKAVNQLFGLGGGFELGSHANTINEEKKPRPEVEAFGDPRRGKVILDDIYFDENKICNDKIFNHVAIDRFTGGAMNGALFSEKVSYFKDQDDFLEINICIDDPVIENEVLAAFEEALKDVCKGLLPLGGMGTKGHGIFTGELSKNSENIFRYP